MALTPAKEAFAADIARRTGLQPQTVRAWVAIENGPDDNPLNIASWDSTGQRSFRGFGSTRAATDATVRLLSSNRYGPVLRVARHPQATIQQELWAIIDSPWEESHYTLNGVRGARLIGTYASLYPRSSTSRVDVVDATPVVRVPHLPGLPGLPGAPDFPDVLPDVTGWVGDLARFLGEKAALAFLYVVFTALAVALIVTGLLRATGTSATSVGARLRPAPDDIPF